MNLGGRRNDAWWKSAVVYQIYPRSFADSNGDGFGDLGGIIGRLDYLRALGVDVIWLSPIYRSPQADNGYDISNYRDIDPLFGSLAEFDVLLAKVHELGMKLVMDLVVNHTSDEHPWFAELRSSRDNPKRDWYIWRDAREGEEPNNWGSFFGGSAWEWEQTTGQYYLHLFDRKQPDLNWKSPQVRKAVHDTMVWWLDRGVDGFRMDVINFISKSEGLPDAPAIPGQRFVSAMDKFVDGPHVHDYLAEMTREVFDGRDGEFITIGEMPGVTTEQARLYPRWTLADPIGGRAGGRYGARGQLHPSNIEARSSISLVRGAAPIENSFAPTKAATATAITRIKASVTPTMTAWAASHVSRIYAGQPPPHSTRPATVGI